MVVARRSFGAKYVEDGTWGCPEIGQLLDEMTWADLKESGKYVDGEQDPCAHLHRQFWSGRL